MPDEHPVTGTSRTSFNAVFTETRVAVTNGLQEAIDFAPNHRANDWEPNGETDLNTSIRVPGPEANQTRITVRVTRETVTVTIGIQQWDLPKPDETRERFIPGQTRLQDYGRKFEVFRNAVTAGIADALNLQYDTIAPAVINGDTPHFTCQGPTGVARSPSALIEYTGLFEVSAFKQTARIAERL